MYVPAWEWRPTPPPKPSLIAQAGAILALIVVGPLALIGLILAGLVAIVLRLAALLFPLAVVVAVVLLILHATGVCPMHY